MNTNSFADHTSLIYRASFMFLSAVMKKNNVPETVQSLLPTLSADGSSMVKVAGRLILGFSIFIAKCSWLFSVYLLVSLGTSVRPQNADFISRVLSKLLFFSRDGRC